MEQMVVMHIIFNISLHQQTKHHIYDHNFHIVYFNRNIINYLSISGAIVIGVPQYDSSNSELTRGLANPKSPNLIYIYSFISIFANLRSRCTTFFKRNIFIASINYKIIGFASASTNLFFIEFFFIYFSKSPKLQNSMIMFIQSLPN